MEEDKSFKLLRDPPTKFTVIHQLNDDVYSVERVTEGCQDLDYSKSLVHSNGMIEIKERYAFAIGLCVPIP